SGFDIVVASPEIEKNEEVAEEIRACSGEAMTVNLDVTSPDSVKEAFAKALADKSRIDVLVNNAGVTRDGLAVRMKQADWDLVLKINLNGAFLCTRAVLPGMMRNRWGRMGKPEDIAAAVKFLTSEDASYITGHVLAVNGGMYM